MKSTYRVTDTLSLWFLANPTAPRLVADLTLMQVGKGVSLRYDSAWLRTGFALSEDLPLADQEFFPADKETAVGAVDDARPDRWGERVIRFIDKPPRLSLLEYLYFAGHDRFGALGVSTSRDEYTPRRLGSLPTLGDVQRLREVVELVLNNEPVPEPERRLISPGVTLGGARPKALVDIDGEQWVAKFNPGDALDTPLIEHATMTLARRAGIATADTRALRVADGHVIAIRRFDRLREKRLHAISAHVALRAAKEPFGYPELAQVLRRRGAVERSSGQMAELFRRMVFNILIDNTDDHEKNHVLLVDEALQFELSPAFDVLPSGQALGYQQMRVGVQEADSTIENALSMCEQFGLTRAQARKEARRVARVVDGWQNHFRAHHVSASDIDALAEHIDRPFLVDQRTAR